MHTITSTTTPLTPTPGTPAASPEDQLQAFRTRTQFQWVPTSQMRAAPYARPISPTKVQGLRRAWDIRAVGTLYLAHAPATAGEPETYNILDGSHRKAAAEAEGFFTLPALVYTGLSYPEEAQLYVQFATVNRQTALDRFRARLQAHDQQALEIEGIIRDEAKLELPLRYVVGAPGYLNAVYTVEMIYRQFGADLLRAVCATIRAAWRGAPRAWTDRLLLGLSMFFVRYREHPHFHVERLVTQLMLTTPEALSARAALIAAGHRRFEMRAALGIAVLDLYNEGLRSERLPDWATRAYATPEARAHQREIALRNLPKNGSQP